MRVINNKHSVGGFKRLRSGALDLGARVSARKRDRRVPGQVARPPSLIINDWAVAIAVAAAAGNSAAAAQAGRRRNQNSRRRWQLNSIRKR